MAFLTLNNYPIPVVPGNTGDIEETGNRNTAFDGSARRSIISSKNTWQLETKQLKEIYAEAVKKLIRGDGDAWPFDLDPYSHKGLGFEDGTAVYTIEEEFGADGDPVDDAGKYGGSLAMWANILNMLPADSRNAENAPTGYSSINGATLSGDTSNYWQGTKSLKVVTDAVGGDKEGAYANDIDPGAGSAGNTYSGSVYLKGNSGGEQVSLNLFDVTNTVQGAATNVVLTNPNTWYRVKCSITIGGSDCRALRLRLQETNIDSNITWYADGFQIEDKDHVTSWVDGSRGTPRLRTYRISNFKSPDLTFNFWTKGPVNGYAGNSYFAYINQEGGANSLSLFGRYDATNRIYFITRYDNTPHTLQYDGAWDGTWKMVTFVLRENPETGENKKEIYIDGTRVAYANPTNTPLYHLYDFMDIGWAATAGNVMRGNMDDLLIVPFAAPEEMIEAWYNWGRAMSSYPFVVLGGDIIPGNELEVQGETRNITNVPYFENGEYKGNAVRIQFRLRGR